MQRLNFANRNKILGLLAVGISQTVVAGQYNVSRSTISRLVQRVNVTGKVDDRPRSDAPRVTSIRQDKLYVNVIYVTGFQRRNPCQML